MGCIISKIKLISKQVLTPTRPYMCKPINLLVAIPSVIITQTHMSNLSRILRFQGQHLYLEDQF